MRDINKKNLQYAFITLILTIISNQVVYQGAHYISLALMRPWDITLPIDYTLPFVPWTLVIYLGSYVIWAVSYIVIALQDDRSQSELFFSAVLLSKLFCLAVFLLVPTTSDIRPVISGSSFFEKVAKTLYSVDFPVDPTNYFPSMHCLASWLCFIGVRGKKQFPIWWQALSFILAVAVFVSTITTRQHVILDVFGGIVFGELSYAMANSYKIIPRTYTKISSFIMGKLFSWKTIEG